MKKFQHLIVIIVLTLSLLPTFISCTKDAYEKGEGNTLLCVVISLRP